RGLGDAEQNRLSLGRLLALLDEALVDLLELDRIDVVAGDIGRVALRGHFHLLQHLPDDHLNVLVVDEHALQPVDFLYLVDEVGSQRLHALDRQDIVRSRITVENEITLLDDVTVLEVERLALRDEVLDRLQFRIVRFDDDAPLVLVVAAETHRAVDFGDDRMILWPTRLDVPGYPL